MAIKTFTAIYGQSIFDVCLNCYGGLDLLYKLIQDSGVDSVNDLPLSGQKYTYDDSLVVDQNVFQRTTLAGTRYATALGNYGSVYYVIQQNPNQNTRPNTPNNPLPPIKPKEMYEKTSSTYYTAAEDGESVITLTDIDGNPLTGKRVIQIEKEIKPLVPLIDYVWNPDTSTLTLLPGNEMYQEQQLFVLYAEIITT